MAPAKQICWWSKPMGEQRERIAVGPWLTAAVFAVAQTGALLWKLSSISTTVEFQSLQISELKTSISAGTSDRYRAVDAARDFDLVRHTLDAMTKRIEALEAKARQ